MRIVKTINSIFLPFAVLTVAAVVLSNNTYADEPEQPKNGDFEIGYKKVNRVEVLKDFFEKYNSPLVDSAETFVEVADQYNMDYKLLPAISCVESTCGKFLPRESYNPFGWGNGTIYFESFDEAIKGVGKGVSEIYISKGMETPEEIAPVYAPPSTTWSGKVNNFSSQISQIAASK